MADGEARTLIEQTVSRLNVRSLLTAANVNDIIATTGGHPYVIKILLGEVAAKRRFRSSRQGS